MLAMYRCPSGRYAPAAIALWAAAVVLIAVFLVSRHQRAQFDSTRWRECRERDGCYDIRSRMTDDLIGRGILLGKSSAEVVALLGPPDAESHGPFDQATVNPNSEFFGHRADAEYNYYVEGYVDPDVVAVYFKAGAVYKVVRHPT
jgi:hypothetical protein